jgi:hypothetical protein
MNPRVKLIILEQLLMGCSTKGYFIPPREFGWKLSIIATSYYTPIYIPVCSILVSSSSPLDWTEKKGLCLFPRRGQGGHAAHLLPLCYYSGGPLMDRLDRSSPMVEEDSKGECWIIMLSTFCCYLHFRKKNTYFEPSHMF